MLIDNDTDDPVDYDIDVAGGGSGGMNMDKDMAGSFTVAPGSAPKFRIPARSQWSLELADPSGICRHIFEIDDGTQTRTVIELRDAPGTDSVRLKQTEHGGERYYRASLFT